LTIVDALTQAGIAAAALAAIIGLLIMIGRGVRRMWNLAQKLDKAAEDILGAPGQPPLSRRMDALTDQVSQLGHRVDEHLTWHSGSGRDRVNGGRRP
jgi:hypothetical protein